MIEELKKILGIKTKEDEIKDLKSELYDVKEKIRQKETELRIKENLYDENKYRERFRINIKKLLSYFDKIKEKDKYKLKPQFRERSETEPPDQLSNTREYYQFTFDKNGMVKIDVDFDEIIFQLDEARIANMARNYMSMKKSIEKLNDEISKLRGKRNKLLNLIKVKEGLKKYEML